jgi:SAM-dependent methyltransferase
VRRRTDGIGAAQHTASGTRRGRQRGAVSLAEPSGFGDTPGVTEAAPAAATCVLCGQPGRPLYSELTDRLFHATGTWSLLSCTGCSLVWLDPQPENTLELYERYYTHDGATAPKPVSLFRNAVTRGIPAARMGYPPAPGAPPFERALGKLLSWVGPLREIAEHGVLWLPVSRRGSLLDVGCGSGLFLERMRDFGWQVTGVEPDAAAASATRQRLGEDCRVVAQIDDPTLAAESFDAISLSHVIEHVPDPVALLARCRQLLAPVGTLVCVTPNSGSLAARSFGASWLHWDPPRHLNIFDVASLGQAIREAGLEIEHVGTPGSSAHFVWQASSLIERRGRVPDADVSGASPALVLESIAFWALEYALTRLGRHCGEEVLAVAKR